MARYCGLNKNDVWQLTLPQVHYYMKQCRKHVEFTIKIQANPLMSMFGGGSSKPAEPKGTYINEDGKEVVDGYTVADESDMEWLAGIL